MKRIYMRDLEDLTYFVDLFNINNEKDFDEQINELVNKEDHVSEFFTTYEAAKDFAFSMVLRTEYNTALICLNREYYGECVDCPIIATIRSDEIENLIASDSEGLTYFWNDYSNGRKNGLSEIVNKTIENHDYEEFMKYYRLFSDETYFRLPKWAVCLPTDNEYDITIKDNFMKIIHSEYENG